MLNQVKEDKNLYTVENCLEAYKYELALHEKRFAENPDTCPTLPLPEDKSINYGKNDGAAWRYDANGVAEDWRLHREDGPAMIYQDGMMTWCYHDKYHRVGAPAEIHPDGTEIWFFEGRRHREDGPALVIPEKNERKFFLHDVEMEEWQVMIDPEKMTPDMITKEENAERRKELIRKFGIERMRSQGKVVDTKTYEENISSGDNSEDTVIKRYYELIDMAAVFKVEEAVAYAPHLMMENPSISGTFHLEAVHPDCKTVQHAINWRKYGDINKYWNPIRLT